jgi:hypothetical protein
MLWFSFEVISENILVGWVYMAGKGGIFKVVLKFHKFEYDFRRVGRAWGWRDV